MLLLQSSRATKAPVGVWVYAAPFLRKIGTKHVGMFSVADYRSSLDNWTELKITETWPIFDRHISQNRPRFGWPLKCLSFLKKWFNKCFFVCRFLSSYWTIRLGKTTDLLSYGQVAQKVYHLSKFTVFGLFLSPSGLGQLRSNFPFLVVYPFCTRRTLFATFGKDIKSLRH